MYYGYFVILFYFVVFNDKHLHLLNISVFYYNWLTEKKCNYSLNMKLRYMQFKISRYQPLLLIYETITSGVFKCKVRYKGDHRNNILHLCPLLLTGVQPNSI